MKDLHSKILVVSLIAAAAYNADVNSGAVDLQGYQSAEIVLPIGVGGINFSGANKIEFVLEHSDDGATFTPVTAADVLGAAQVNNGIIKALTAPQAAATVSRFGYKGSKRYLRLTADFSGVHGTATPLAALLIKANGYLRPEADQA